MFKIKKILAVAVVVCMLMCLYPGSVIAKSYTEQNGDSNIEPYNIAVAKSVYNFSINANGIAKCYGKVDVIDGYTAQLTMQLQQKGSMWKTMKSWTDKNSHYVALDETYQVEKGYDYRLMVVYIAYDSDGNQVEAFYDVSNIVEYK